MHHFRFVRLLCAGAIMMGVSAAAQQLTIDPPFGVDRSVTVGSAIVIRSSRAMRDMYVPAETMTKKILWASLSLPAGQPIPSVYASESKVMACQAYSGPCVHDMDGDGTFDRIAVDTIGTGLPLKIPTRYATIQAPNPDADQHKQTIIYLGASADTLRLSYREFVNDLARPAFTEELSLPLGNTFPQTVAVKDVRMTILSVDGMGLRYRIER